MPDSFQDKGSSRSSRQALIRRILQEHHVSSQEQLASLLADHSIACTQATLSRDLRDMGVHRVQTAAGPRYHLDQSARYMKALTQVVGMEILEVRHNGALVVLRTLSGRAQGVAAYLDAREDLEILGTVAGDDTVFVAPTDLSRCDALVAAIRALSEGSSEPA